MYANHFLYNTSGIREEYTYLADMEHRVAQFDFCEVEVDVFGGLGGLGVFGFLVYFSTSKDGIEECLHCFYIYYIIKN